LEKKGEGNQKRKGGGGNRGKKGEQVLGRKEENKAGSVKQGKEKGSGTNEVRTAGEERRKGEKNCNGGKDPAGK